jgi:hypothetical protein
MVFKIKKKIANTATNKVIVIELSDELKTERIKVSNLVGLSSFANTLKPNVPSVPNSMIPNKSKIPIKIMIGNKKSTLRLSLFGKKLIAFWNNRKLAINF